MRGLYLLKVRVMGQRSRLLGSNFKQLYIQNYITRVLWIVIVTFDLLKELNIHQASSSDHYLLPFQEWWRSFGQLGCSCVYTDFGISASITMNFTNTKMKKIEAESPKYTMTGPTDHLHNGQSNIDHGLRMIPFGRSRIEDQRSRSHQLKFLYWQFHWGSI